MVAVAFCSLVSWFLLALFFSMLDFTDFQATLFAALTVGAALVLARSPLAERAVAFFTKVGRNPAVEETVRGVLEKYLPADLLPAGLKIGFVSNPYPNAFAIGRGTLAVTAGLLQNATEAELAGVLAHEVGHLRSGDGVRNAAMGFVLVPGILGAGAVVLVLALVFRLVFKWPSSASEGSWAASGSMGGFAVSFFAAFFGVLAWAAVLASRAASRAAEYRADTFAGRVSRATKEGLVSFLEKLRSWQGKRGFSFAEALTATHPPLEDRIARLRAM
jgi:heat shock protein HtpX